MPTFAGMTTAVKKLCVELIQLNKWKWGAVKTQLSKANIFQIRNNYAVLFDNEAPGRVVRRPQICHQWLTVSPRKRSLMTFVIKLGIYGGLRVLGVWWHLSRQSTERQSLHAWGNDLMRICGQQLQLLSRKICAVNLEKIVPNLYGLVDAYG